MLNLEGNETGTTRKNYSNRTGKDTCPALVKNPVNCATCDQPIGLWQ